MIFIVFWRGSGENRQITSAQDRGVSWRLIRPHRKLQHYWPARWRLGGLGWAGRAGLGWAACCGLSRPPGQRRPAVRCIATGGQEDDFLSSPRRQLLAGPKLGRLRSNIMCVTLCVLPATAAITTAAAAAGAPADAAVAAPPQPQITTAQPHSCSAADCAQHTELII